MSDAEPRDGVTTRSSLKVLQPDPAWHAAKRFVLGRRRATTELASTLLPKRLALPIFASDCISSVAYATEAALIVLVAASATAASLVLPISVAVAGLLAIVAASYTQVVRAYRSSGGAYVVARENLGTGPALVAGAALLIDYTLTVAVSVASGVLALTSAVPALAGSEVELSLVFIGLIAFVNLRGLREAGRAFALPTYGFILIVYAMFAVALAKGLSGGFPQVTVPNPLQTGAGAIGVFVVLRAFASGASALTGAEAIANGVGAFRPPQDRNAARTLVTMAVLAITLFLGISFLAVQMGAMPSGSVSVLSEIARATFPASSSLDFVYYVVQFFTLAILVLAANTSFQGFPRLAALMARDGFFPRQFSNLGDRLVFSNGVIVLTLLAAGLIVVFKASVNELIHLYVLGVFTAFTLSQAGMVRYWLRTREPGWRWRAALNATGAVATGLVAVVVIGTKFGQGGWMVVVAVPILSTLFVLVHRHYAGVDRRLRVDSSSRAAELSNETVVYVERLDAATDDALSYARAVSGTSFRVVHVPFEGSDPAIAERFRDWYGDAAPRFELVPREGGVVASLRRYLQETRPPGLDYLTVVIPEFFARKSLATALLRRHTLSLKLHLLPEPGIVVTDVPRVGGTPAGDLRPVVLVPISGVHAAALRAVDYARALGIREARAVFFAPDEDEAQRVRDAWERLAVELPLEIVDTPYRGIGEPLLAQVRRITAHDDSTAVIVMAELQTRGLHRLLHNQHALFIKRLLLFEPRVVLASVPYRLD